MEKEHKIKSIKEIEAEVREWELGDEEWAQKKEDALEELAGEGKCYGCLELSKWRCPICKRFLCHDCAWRHTHEDDGKTVNPYQKGD